MLIRCNALSWLKTGILVTSKFIHSVDDPGYLTEGVKDVCSVELCFVTDVSAVFSSIPTV